MKTIRRQFEFREMLWTFVPTFLVIVMTLVALQFCNAFGWFSPPRIWHGYDPVLVHQFRASKLRDPTRMILLGDSTCLVGVDALRLSRTLPDSSSVLNLSLYIWLDLMAYGEEMTNLAFANPGQLQWVVLLVTPDKLAGLAQPRDGMRVWKDIRAQQLGLPGDASRNIAGDWSGVGLLREQVFDRLIELPIVGKSSDSPGFTSQIDKYMTDHRGSLIDPTPTLLRKQFRDPTWTLAPAFEAQSRAFRSMVPPGAKLVIGFTPSPRNKKLREDFEHRDALLRSWNNWIQADVVLTNLPVTLPNEYFTASAHLNALGQKRFTQHLANALQPYLEAPEVSSAISH